MASEKANLILDDSLNDVANRINQILVDEPKLSKIQECLDTLTLEDRRRVVNRNRNDLPTPLSSAVHINCPDIVRYMVEQCGGDTSVTSRLIHNRNFFHFVTPLCLAAFVSSLELVKILLQHDADINWINDAGWSALTFACSRNTTANVVEYLIHHGADVFIRDSKNRNLLCFSDCMEVNQLLIQHKLDVNHIDANGKTALYYAVKRKALQTTKYFVSCGADVTHRVGDNLNVLFLAALERQEELVQFFLKTFLFSVKEEIQAYKLLGVAFAINFLTNSKGKAYTYWMKSLEICNTRNKASSLEENNSLTELPFILDGSECSTIESLELIKQEDSQIDDEVNLDYLRQACHVAINILGPAHSRTLRVLKRYADENSSFLQRDHIALPMYEYIYRTYALNLPKYALHMRSLSVLIQIMSTLFIFRRDRQFGWTVSGSVEHGVALSSLSLEYINSIMELVVNYQLSAKTMFWNRSPVHRQHAMAIAYSQLPCAIQDLTILHCEAKAGVVTSLTEDKGITCRTAESENKSVDFSNYKNNIRSFEDQIRRIIQGDVRDEHGEGPLHWAIDKKMTKCCYERINGFPRLDVIELFIRCGADVNLVSNGQVRNTPLACLLDRQSRHPLAQDNASGVYKAIAERLLSEGAHIDICCGEGELLLDHMRRLGYDILPLKYITLQCMAAKTITRFNIPYHDTVPQVISRFIELHSESA